MTTRSVRSLSYLLWAGLTVAACSSPVATGSPPSADAGTDAGSPTLCTPGAQVACACVGGAAGAQVCGADGRSFGACACPDAGGAMDVVDVPPVIDVPPAIDVPPPPDVPRVVDVGFDRGFDVGFDTGPADVGFDIAADARINCAVPGQADIPCNSNGDCSHCIPGAFGEIWCCGRNGVCGITSDPVCPGPYCDSTHFCAAGQTCCGTHCHDLQNDRVTCGSCNYECSSVETCVAGMCRLPPADAGASADARIACGGAMPDLPCTTHADCAICQPGLSGHPWCCARNGYCALTGLLDCPAP